ncbi:MAG: hypothetical protein K0U37_09645 [Gammaproteobacteria bacterium]|nr:hypothetical protein [Gammaproteobacteria bacterium]
MSDPIDTVEIVLKDVLDKIEVYDVLEDLVLDVLTDAPTEDRWGEFSSEHAFDYDGCIGNNRGDKKIPEELVAAEPIFWAYVKERIHNETKGLPRDRRCVSIATARQSKRADDYCTQDNDSTSCFPLYPYVADYLDAEKDLFLLADAKKQLPTATSFQRAVDSEYEGEHEEWYFDESKITIIYAKMHRSAMCNPDGVALFTFYDDRQDILNALSSFFRRNEALLPHNLILNLCHYERGSELIRRYKPIIGLDNPASLGIDYDYKYTVTKIGAYIDSLAKEEGAYRVPIGIEEIVTLNLGKLMYELRVAPEEETASEEERPPEEVIAKVRVGNMIFAAADDAQLTISEKAREMSSCTLDAMMNSSGWL